MTDEEDFDTWLENHPNAVIQGHSYDHDNECTQNALNLARTVLRAIDKAGREKLDVLMGKGTVEDICERANEILATE